MKPESEVKALEVVDVPGVSTSRRSVLCSRGDGRSVAVLVHGIFDNVWRWTTPQEAEGLVVAEDPPPIPLFDASAKRESILGSWTAPFEAVGLMARLAAERIPAVAYSYQDVVEPLAKMDDAVEALHRTATWAQENLDAQKILLVGHSRGGLVCRHALTTDSRAATAEKFRSRVDRLIAVCTPHLGSQAAEFVDLWTRTLARYTEWSAPLSGVLPSIAPLEAAAEVIRGIGRLTPCSAEIQRAASSRMPELPGGYFAIAGATAAYFSASFRAGGGFRLPPDLGIPEFIDGEGDMAVSVASALDLPGAGADRTRVYPFNHLTLPYAASVHDQIVAWLTAAC